ncbi:MAG TPA: ABC transporter permease [Pseudolysinimonas sp.]|jgi:peptide/nickel transport system permease protein
MLTFLSRRLIASILVLLAASYVVYLLSANAGDPLDDLRTSTARNKEELIQQRIALLHLDIPAPLRYFIWLGGVLKVFIGQFDLGRSLKGQAVTDLLASAVGVTIQLLISATLLAIVFGILIGITTALRQYSGYDYTVTGLSFLFFSLPSFFVAVILKQYVGIGFNNFLAAPVYPWWVILIVALLAGGIWQGIVGGDLRRRLITVAVAGGATGAVMTYVSATNWLNNPSLTIGVIGVLGVGLAFLVAALTAGLANRKSLYTALTVVVIGLAIYYPFNAISDYLTIWSVLGLGVLAVVVGIVVGYLWGGTDRRVSARTGGITAFLVAFLIAIDRFMRSWSNYANSDIINGRPIGTVGAGTPNLSDVTSNFWIEGLDNFTHLLLPTTSLLLISLAAYSRYSRASLLDVLNQDYIRTARAKGLSERAVIMRHAFRNALIPITTIVAFDFGGLIGGAIITEIVFGWSGMGKLFNDALSPIPDVNPLMGFFLVTGGVAVLFNLLADLSYTALDPRIRVAV